MGVILARPVAQHGIDRLAIIPGNAEIHRFEDVHGPIMFGEFAEIIADVEAQAFAPDRGDGRIAAVLEAAQHDHLRIGPDELGSDVPGAGDDERHPAEAVFPEEGRVGVVVRPVHDARSLLDLVPINIGLDAGHAQAFEQIQLGLGVLVRAGDRADGDFQRPARLFRRGRRRQAEDAGDQHYNGRIHTEISPEYAHGRTPPPFRHLKIFYRKHGRNKNLTGEAIVVPFARMK